MPKFNGNRPDAWQGSQRAADLHVGNPPGQPQAPARVRGGRPGSSFAARFGRVILQHGIAAIPSALYHYQGQLGLSAQQVWFVSYILSHKWDEDLPYPSLKKMARCVTLSLSQLQRIKNSLCQAGYLQVYPRFGQTRGQDTNAYDFSGLFDRLEEAIMHDSPAANAIRAEGESPDMAELAELDSSFVARYGRVITRHGVAAVPRAIFTHQAGLNLTPQQVWFITYIFSFQWDTALPFPSIRRMAAITGYSTVQLHNIKSELVEAGYLRLVRRKDELGGQDTNAYDFSGLLDAVRAHLQPESRKGEARHNEEAMPQTSPLSVAKRRGRRVRRDRTEPGSAQLTGEARKDLSDGDSAQLSRGDRIQLSTRDSVRLSEGDSREFAGRGSDQFAEGVRRGLPGRDSTQISGPGKRTVGAGTSRAYRRGVARGLHEEETVQQEEYKKNDSNHLSPSEKKVKKTEAESAHPPYSPYIAAIITDFSNELNDPTHVVSNVTQTLRIWAESGLSEQAFTELLYEAKRTTRQYQGKQGLGTINNKMAYFFMVLRDLCNRPG